MATVKSVRASSPQTPTGALTQTLLEAQVALSNAEEVLGSIFRKLGLSSSESSSTAPGAAEVTVLGEASGINYRLARLLGDLNTIDTAI